jgi:hypothetical protein
MFEPRLLSTPLPARVLLSIDYESWFALTRRFDGIASSQERMSLDGGFSRKAVDPILDQLGAARASFFMVGEIVEWYPEVAAKIEAAGHELGFHCHTHRSLSKVDDLEKDLNRSQVWRKQFGVRGYRAPMVRISEEGYPLLARTGFSYSSSIYAPAGSLFQNSGIWEIPVSTWKLNARMPQVKVPRNMSMNLLMGGELPFGSSLMTGLSKSGILRLIEQVLRSGHSPVIFLHPYELVHPENWPGRILQDLLRNPLLVPFTLNKSDFLRQVVRNFPVSSLGAWLDEALGVGGSNG